MTHQQIKKDWEYINDKYGLCEDMCGDICNTELFIGLLKGTITKTECFIAMMQRYFEVGPEFDRDIFKQDAKVLKIYNRWLKEELIK